jgi:hypothetical protein
MFLTRGRLSFVARFTTFDLSITPPPTPTNPGAERACHFLPTGRALRLGVLQTPEELLGSAFLSP